MQQLVSLVTEVLVLTALTMVCEFLLPSGRIRNTAATAARLTCVAAICDEIIGIFARWGV